MPKVCKKINDFIGFEDLIAFHGTSLHKTKLIFNEQGFQLRTYFAVNYNNFKSVLNFSEEIGQRILPEEYRDLCTTQGAFNEARNYARNQRFYDCLEEKFGLKDYLDEFSLHPLNFIDDENGQLNKELICQIINNGKNYDYTKEYLTECVLEALKYKGVIFGLGRKFFADKVWNDFEYNEADICYPSNDEIHDNVGLEYVDVCFCLGQRERNILMSNYFF